MNSHAVVAGTGLARVPALEGESLLDDGENESSNGGDIANQVAQGVATAGQVAAGVTACMNGDGAGATTAFGGATGSVLDQVGGNLGGETGQTVSSVSTAANTSASAASTTTSLLANDADLDAATAGNVLSIGSTVAGISGGCMHGTAAIAQSFGASSEVTGALNGIGQGLTVAGQVAQQALGIYRQVTQTISDWGPDPRVKYKLKTWNTVEAEGDGDTWRIHSIELCEAINECPEAIVTAEFLDVDIMPEKLLGADAEITFARKPFRRTYKGVIRSVFHGATDLDSTRVRLHIVPAFLLGEQRVNTRIWQQQSVPEILKEVLRGVLEPLGRKANLDNLRATYLPREYCVQYQESDYDFACRLMQEEAINFHFVYDPVRDPNAEEAPAGSEEFEVMMLNDRNADFASIDKDEPFPITPRVSGGVEGICDFQRKLELVPTGVLVGGDWDFTACTHNTAEEHADGEPNRCERIVNELNLGEGRSDSDAAHNERTRTRRAENLRKLHRTREQVCMGLGFVSRMKPGMTFKIVDHPDPNLSGEYLLTRVTHVNAPAPGPDATAAYNYHNRFECIRSDVDLVPRRTQPKPRIMGCVSAIVCGRSDAPPADQDSASQSVEHPVDSDITPIDEHRVHTDKRGRVRLWFPWDRRGRRDDRSTCWVRVQQPWAGSSWGSTFVPHVGMEAIVTFINGDPDRPIVTGTVYNGKNSPSLDTSDDGADYAMSGIRTVRNNELRFNDTAGGEEIYWHARRDARSEIENDRADHVANDDAETVDGAQTCKVGGDRSHSVGGKETITITKERAVTINGGLHRIHVASGDAGGGEHRVTTDDKVYVECPNEIVFQIKGGSMIRMTKEKIELHAGDGAILDLDSIIAAISKDGAGIELSTIAAMRDSSTSAQVILDNAGNASLTSDSGTTILAGRDSASSTSPDGSSQMCVANGEATITSSGVISLDGGGSTCTLDAAEANLAGLKAVVAGGGGASTLTLEAASGGLVAPTINLN